MRERTRGGDGALNYVGRLSAFGLTAALMLATLNAFPDAGVAWAPLLLWFLGLAADGAIAWLAGARGKRLAAEVGATLLVWAILAATWAVTSLLQYVPYPEPYSVNGVVVTLLMFFVAVGAASVLPQPQATMAWAIMGVGSALALDANAVATGASAASLPLALALCLGSSAAFIVYLRHAFRARLGWRALAVRLGWAAAALGFSLVVTIFSLGYVTTTLVEQQLQENSSARLSYVHGVALDLAERIPESEIASATPRLVDELMRFAGANSVGLTVWDLRDDRAVLAVRRAPQLDVTSSAPPVYRFTAVVLSDAERDAVSGAIHSGSDVALGPAFGAQPPVVSTITERFALVATDPNTDWQESPGFTTSDVRRAFSASMFPWLFLAFLLPCSLALIAIDRRDTARASLAASEERARLNRDAHDRIYNRLTALANRLAATEPPDATPPTPAEEIRLTVSSLQAILGDDVPTTRATPEPAIASLLADVCADQARVWGMEVELDGTEALEGIDPRVGWELLCFAEEALTNAGKHAHATRVRVHLAAAAGTLVLAVIDDGSGIAAPLGLDGLPDTATGMRGMRDRVKALGGDLEIVTGPTGTSVTATIPRTQR